MKKTGTQKDNIIHTLRVCQAIVFLLLLLCRTLTFAQEFKVIDNKGTFRTVTFNNVTTATTAPTSPVEGDVWFDTTTNNSKIHDGSSWIIIDEDTVNAGTNAPTTPVQGDIWFDTANDITKVWDGGAWQEIKGVSTLSLWDKDEDTGIQVEESSDEDNIRFDTAGNERLILDDNGRLLFANPGDFDNSGGSPTSAVLGIDGTTHGRLRLTAGSQDTFSDSEGASIDLHANSATSNTGVLDLVAGQDASGTNAAIKFWTNSTGAGGGQDTRAVITGNGDVGIGTTAPDNQVHIYSDTAQGNLTTSGQMTLNDDDASLILEKRMSTINQGGGRAGPILDFRSTNGTNRWSVSQIMGLIDAGSTNHAGGLAFLTQDGGGVNPADSRTQGNHMQTRMLIQADGDVGIGTSAPDNLTHLYSETPQGILGAGGQLNLDDAEATLILEHQISGTNQNGGNPGALIDFRTTNGGGQRWSTAQILGLADAGGTNYRGGLAFLTQNGGNINPADSRTQGNHMQTRMLIQADGDVGINTTSPTQKLDVRGSARVDEWIYDENNERGTAGQILSTTATGIDWIDVSASSSGTTLAVRATTTTNASGNGKINYTAEDFDTQNAFDLATDQFKPSVAGYYLINLVNWYNGITGNGAHAYARFYKNGSHYSSGFTRRITHNNLTSELTELVYLNGSTDYIECQRGSPTGYLDTSAFSAVLINEISTSGTGSDDQNIEGLALNTTTNVLTVGIEDGNSQTLDLSGIVKEPWFGDDDDAAATTNSEDMYHMGNIGIGVDDPGTNKLNVQDGPMHWSMSATNTNHTIDLTTPSGETGLIFNMNSTGNRSRFDIKNVDLVTEGNRYLEMAFNGDSGLRIRKGGNIGIGSITPTQSFDVNGNVRIRGLGAGDVQSDASGNLSVSSDERLKNITGSFGRGLDAIIGLKPIKYKWNKASGLEMENTYSGFSAQNVRQNIPEAVSVDNKGYLTLSDRSITAALVNSVKELKAENEELKTRLAKIEKALGLE